MRLPEEVDANIQTISAAPACSLEDQALPAEFNALATCQRPCRDTARGSDTTTPLIKMLACVTVIAVM